jgi:hypothetical protein
VPFQRRGYPAEQGNGMAALRVFGERIGDDSGGDAGRHRPA